MFLPVLRLVTKMGCNESEFSAFHSQYVHQNARDTGIAGMAAVRSFFQKLPRPPCGVGR